MAARFSLREHQVSKPPSLFGGSHECLFACSPSKRRHAGERLMCGFSAYCLSYYLWWVGVLGLGKGRVKEQMLDLPISQAWVQSHGGEPSHVSGVQGCLHVQGQLQASKHRIELWLPDDFPRFSNPFDEYCCSSIIHRNMGRGGGGKRRGGLTAELDDAEALVLNANMTAPGQWLARMGVTDTPSIKTVLSTSSSTKRVSEIFNLFLTSLDTENSERSLCSTHFGLTSRFVCGFCLSLSHEE